MRRSGHRTYAWAVTVCNYEACWNIAYFLKENDANSYRDRYKLDESNFERSVTVHRIEIF